MEIEDFYTIIENKIKASGYNESISGEAIYNEICDEIEEKENGSYIFMVKQTDDTFFEYKIDVLDDDFNLSYVKINTPIKIFEVDFDA